MFDDHRPLEFTEEELEIIAAVLEEYGYNWATYNREARLVNSILEKIEQLLDD